jgi:hypothetical protein
VTTVLVYIHEQRKELDELKNSAPQLKLTPRVGEMPIHEKKHGKLLHPWAAYFEVTNEPDINSPESVARSVSATIDVSLLGGIQRLMRISGSWADWRDINADVPLTDITPRFEIDIPPNDVPVRLYLAIRQPLDNGNHFAHIFSQHTIYGDWRIPDRAIEDGSYLIRVALNGIGVSRPLSIYYFRLEFHLLGTVFKLNSLPNPELKSPPWRAAINYLRGVRF